MQSVVPTGTIPKVDHRTAMDVAATLNGSFLALLSSLETEEWSNPTDCELWSVKDIAAHVLGWAEYLTTRREFAHQTRGALARRKEMGGILHAHNQTQVDDRSGLEPGEVLARLQAALPRFLRFRNVVGRVGVVIPGYYPIVGFGSVRYLIDTIFNRDLLMHRIDISRATGRDLMPTDADARVVTDIVRDWSRRAKVPLRLELQGPGGGTYVTGPVPVATVTASSVELCRFFAGRDARGAIEVEGDEARAWEALAVGCPF